MKKASIILMFLTIFSKLSGLIRDLTLSYFYGATNISDAYLISMMIPLTIFAFIGTAISITYIPLYNSIQEKEGYGSVNNFTNNLLNIVLLSCTVLSIICMIFAESIVKIFAVGFAGETFNIAVKLTKISVFGTIFTTSVYIFSGYLRINGSYKVVSLISIPRNIVIITSIYISVKTNIWFLGIGSLFAIFIELLILSIISLKKGWRYRFILDFKDKNIKKIIYMSLPIVFGTSINQINKIIDKSIASKLAEGGISALNYATRLDLFIQSIFVLSITTIMYPIISKLNIKEDYDSLKSVVLESINSVMYFLIPSTIGVMMFSNEIIMFVYGRGFFDENALKLTSSALFFYSIGIVGYGLREIFSRVFYSLHDTKTPIVNASIGISINIILNIVLSKILGIGGLALATSISALITTLLLFFNIKRKIGFSLLKYDYINFVKILSSSLIMVFLVNKIYFILILSISKNISLFISIFSGSIIYIILTIILKVDNLDFMSKILKAKFRNENNI